MKIIRVLVTGAGGCTVGEGLIKALNTCKEYEIFASDIDVLSPHLYRVKRGFLVPRANEPDYINFMIDLCRKHKIDVLIPGSDFENRVLATVRNKVQNPIILTNTPEVVQIGSDGWHTYQFLKKNGFDCPASCLKPNLDTFLKNNDFPLIIKPRFSQGSHHVYKVDNKKNLRIFLEDHQQKKVESLIQKYVGTSDEEYTVGVLSTKEKRIVSVVALKRTLIAGASYKMTVTSDPVLSKIANNLSSAIESEGPLNFQARKENEKYYIFEINPRFSGTTPVRCGLGVNEPDLLINNFLLKKPLKYVSPRKDVAICRVFQECYIPISKMKQLRGRGTVSGDAKFIDYI